MDAFAAVADPTRRAIVALLAAGEQPSGAIARAMRITPPAVSQHMAVLKEAGLVRVRPEKQKRFYALAPEGVAEIEDWVREIKSFWAPKLDALEAALMKEDDHG